MWQDEILFAMDEVFGYWEGAAAWLVVAKGVTPPYTGSAERGTMSGSARLGQLVEIGPRRRSEVWSILCHVEFLAMRGLSTS